MITVPAWILGVLMATASTANAGTDGIPATRIFGHLPDGRPVTEYTLTSASGMRARILDYGGIIRELLVPDRWGNPADVVLGFDALEPYVQRHPYFGAIVGRYAGRIANGRFSIDGSEITLATNKGGNHLHGGVEGFDRAVWSASIAEGQSRLTLSHVSPDGDEGYPGTLSVEVTYTLTEDALQIVYTAATDKPTIVNLTQHSYFNLAGQDSGDVLGHGLRVEADSILEVDEASIPTGRQLPVSNTPFDFRLAKPIGRDIDAGHPQLEIAKGYDHTFVLAGESREPAVELVEPVSGRRLEVYTTQPGVQVYTANYLDGSIEGKGGQVYRKHAGIALETQHFPDSPNHPAFPSTVLRPGETFESRTVYRFPAPGNTD